VAKAPAGRHVEWDAEITDDQPGDLIAWRSIEGSDVTDTGRGFTAVQAAAMLHDPDHDPDADPGVAAG